MVLAYASCMLGHQASTSLDTAVPCDRQGAWLAHLQVRPEEQALHARDCKGVALLFTELLAFFQCLGLPQCGQAS